MASAVSHHLDDRLPARYLPCVGVAQAARDAAVRQAAARRIDEQA
jgi:hypothetical protein